MVDRIILVGMMGAGKTTVGRLLAEHLAWPYLDSDAQVMAATGRSVPELFAEQGEAAFRSEEERVLAEFATRFAASARKSARFARHDQVDGAIGADGQRIVVGTEIGVGALVLHIGAVAPDADQNRLAALRVGRDFARQR